MALREEILSAVKQVVATPWNKRDGTAVPTTDTVNLADGAVLLDAVYLYADMADSTGLARDFAPTTAAKVIRAFLTAAVRVIQFHDGEIRSFDGDRVMAIYIGTTKRTSAMKTGLKINWAVQNVVRPAVEKEFPSLVDKGYVLSHCVGIAVGQSLIVRGGVRGSNDLVSVGRAPNVAAKLSEIRNGKYRTYVTGDVFDKAANEAQVSSSKEGMWEEVSREVGGEKLRLFRSFWTWEL